MAEALVLADTNYLRISKQSENSACIQESMPIRPINLTESIWNFQKCQNLGVFGRKMCITQNVRGPHE